MKGVGVRIYHAALLLMLVSLFGCGGSSGSKGEYLVVANRASGSFSVIDIKTDTVNTYALPAGDLVPEPMYIVFSPENNVIYIGDRANKRLVIYDTSDYENPAGFVDVGAGIFHMWGEPAHNQLWVNNDIDKTISVVDMLNSSIITTIPVPVELLSGKPHDVILDPNAPFAYVTILGVDGVGDYVIKYSTATFTEVDRIKVGDDPHVALSKENDILYIPTQGGNGVAVVDRSSFDLVTTIPVANAHGAGLNSTGDTFFTTNIANAGVGGLVSVDTASNEINSEVDTPFSIPHNIVLSPDQSKLFLTHSGGTNDMVTVWDVQDTSKPVFLKSLTTEFNPYGLVIVIGQ